MRPVPFSGKLSYTLIFWTACLIWVLPEIVASKTKRSSHSSMEGDRGSLRLIEILWWGGMAADFAMALFLPQAYISRNRTFHFFGGICLMLSGVALRWYSAALLGGYFTFDVAVRSDQTVIQEGPYRYIRHPSYSGALLSLVGFGLALGNWAGLLAFLLLMAFAYSYRIPVEEAALAAGLGEPYKHYMKKTWRIIPFLF